MSNEPHRVVVVSPHRDSAAARSTAAAFLAQYCPWADSDAVLLVVAELVSNSVRHASGWWRLRLTAEGGTLKVEMDDSSPAAPVARRPDFGGGGGFGWHMVLRLAEHVEIRPLPEGKRVRAVWRRPTADGRGTSGARGTSGIRGTSGPGERAGRAPPPGGSRTRTRPSGDPRRQRPVWGPAMSATGEACREGH